jgi:hypothetical protein
MTRFENFRPARERRMILSLLLLSGFLCAGLLFSGFFPARARKNEQLLELVQLTARLNPYQDPTKGKSSLTRQLEQEKTLNTRLSTRAESLKTEVSTFPTGSAPSLFLASSEGGRIDFKVALFDARQTLTRRAEEKKIALPPDLGMDETIAAGEDSETRLWQLAATVRLLDNLLAEQIQSIDRIRPKPPLMIDLFHPDYVGLWEYPIAVQFRCTFPALLKVMERLRQPDHFFSLRRIQIEEPGGTEQEPLLVQLTAGAGVLRGTANLPRPRTEREVPDPLLYLELDEPRE